MSRIGLVRMEMDRAAGWNWIEGSLAAMALVDLHTSGYRPHPDMDAGDWALCAPPCHCAIAIGALDKATLAIAYSDIEARCVAVATATEAMTSLFLEFDGINQDFAAQGAGRLYESILGCLMRINLDNDSEMAREAIAMIERLRDACARWNGADARPKKMAVRRAET